MRTTPLLVLVLAAGSYAAALDTHATQPADAGLDAAFLGSWLGLDAGRASQLVSDGAKAAVARRQMLQSAANFGEAALPGSYPPPLPSVTVNFTAFLPRPTTAANFNRARWLFQVNQQVRLSKVGLRPIQAPVSTIIFVNPNGVNNGIFVRTRVVMKEKVTAQSFLYRLRVDPGPRAPWLVNAYGRDANLFSFSTQVPCNANSGAVMLCKFCFTNPAVCDQCAAFTGTKNTPAYKTIYKNRAGVCSVCTNPNCAFCRTGGTGQCATCKNTYFLTPLATCCKDQLCLRCPGTSCTQCEARTIVNGVSVPVRLIRGRCTPVPPRCTRPGCAVCTPNGQLCRICRQGFRWVRPGFCIRTTG